MNRLRFEPMNGPVHDLYRIFNEKDQYLGEIKAHRVGRFLQWVFSPVAVGTTGDLWFTGPCLDEIRAFHKGMTKRHGRARLHFLK